MSQAQHLGPAVDGLGNYKSSGGSLASSSILTLLGLTAFPQNFYGNFDIKVVAGPVFMTNNGAAATANSMQFDVGDKREIRNCNALASNIRIFASGAYDIRIELYTGGTP